MVVYRIGRGSACRKANAFVNTAADVLAASGIKSSGYKIIRIGYGNAQSLRRKFQYRKNMITFRSIFAHRTEPEAAIPVCLYGDGIIRIHRTFRKISYDSFFIRHTELNLIRIVRIFRINGVSHRSFTGFLRKGKALCLQFDLTNRNFICSSTFGRNKSNLLFPYFIISIRCIYRQQFDTAVRYSRRGQGHFDFTRLST